MSDGARRLIEDELIGLGYQNVAGDIWFKPVGWHLLTFEVGRRVWANWIIDIHGNLTLYDSKTFDPCVVTYPFVDWLRDAECYTRLSIDIRSDFTIKQVRTIYENIERTV